jgi:hypothetical protein
VVPVEGFPMAWIKTLIDKNAKYLTIAAMVVVTAVLAKVLQAEPALPPHPLMAFMMVLMAVQLGLMLWMLCWFNEHRATMWHMQGGFVLAGLLWWLMLGLSWWMLAVPMVMVVLLMWDEFLAELHDEEL